MDDERPWWRQATGRPPWLPRLGERKVYFIVGTGYAVAAILGLGSFLISRSPFQAFTPLVFGSLAAGYLWRAYRLPGHAEESSETGPQGRGS